MSLAKQLDKNMVIEPGIDETATLELKQVTFEEALEHLLSPLHLTYGVEEQAVVVSREKMQTRIFHLNYILSKRQGSSRLRSLGGVGSRLSQPSLSASSVFSSEEADIWREIHKGLKQIVLSQTARAGAQAPRGEGEWTARFSIQEQSGIILVNHYPDVLLKVARFLENVEGSVQRQVFIQAKIIEVTLNEENRLGIDWRKLDPYAVWRGEVSGHPVSTLAGANVELHHRGADRVIEALSRQGRVRMLSSPKIATLNNQRALIKVGTEDIYFIPEVSPATATQSASTAFIPEPVSEGIVLDVLPQINPNGQVMMSIHTSISERVGERVSPDGVNAVPILDVRQSNNVILAGSGQTIVIGGLMKNRRHQTEESHPVFGGLFHEEIDGEEKTELVILLTPEVMAGARVDERYEIEKKRIAPMSLFSPNEDNGLRGNKG